MRRKLLNSALRTAVISSFSSFLDSFAAYKNKRGDSVITQTFPTKIIPIRLRSGLGLSTRQRSCVLYFPFIRPQMSHTRICSTCSSLQVSEPPAQLPQHICRSGRIQHPHPPVARLLGGDGGRRGAFAGRAGAVVSAGTDAKTPC